MTYREKLKMEHPDKVGRMHIGGCKSCPHRYGYCTREDNKPICLSEEFVAGPNERRCSKCWDQEIPGTEKPKETPDALPADIRQLIEAQIGKKDRYVSIFISENGISVDIYPYPFPEEDNK